MTAHNKSDKERDFIFLSESSRSQTPEFLDALQRAIDEVNSLPEVPDYVPLQPEQEQESSELSDLDHTQPPFLEPDRHPAKLPRAPSLPPEMFAPRRLNTHPPGKSGTALPDFANLRSLRASVTPMSTKHPLHGTAQVNPSQYDSNTQERAAAEFSDDEHPQSYRPSIERAPDDLLSYQGSSGPEQSFDLEEQHRRQAALTRLTQHQYDQYDQYEEPAAVNDNAHVRGRDWLALGVSFGLVTIVAGAVGFFVIQFWAAGSLVLEQNTPETAGARAIVIPGKDQSSPKPAARLMLSELSGATNQPVALGVSADAAPSGASIMVRGMPAGSRINAGTAAGEGAWRVPVRDLGHAAIMPPLNFVGTMNLSIDLRLADSSIADSDVLRLNWTPAAADSLVPKSVRTTSVAGSTDPFQPPPVPKSVAVAPAANSVESPAIEQQANRAVASPGVRQLDRDEVVNLLKRGESAFGNGDVAAARLLLRRAAEAGNARAAMILAATYDPRVLQQIGALGAEADTAQAAAWYKKASEMGSAEAAQQLQQLAKQ